jgi:polysaccharide export outer membrane protein
LIPAKPITVSIVGSVYNQNAFLYRDGSALREYLDQAGGSTREADRDRLFVIRADGSVISKQMHRSIWAGNFGSLKVMPGDTVVVPQRFRTGSTLRAVRDWTQIFSQFALGAAALKVIVNP